MVLGLRLGHLGTSVDVVLEVTAHVLPSTQTLDQQIGSLYCRDEHIVSRSYPTALFRCSQGPVLPPGRPERTSLLSVWGIASSSLIDVRRVKPLLTVPDRWGSLASLGLVGDDMADSAGTKRAGKKLGSNS
jgi:hypothetical protein